jgi:hypothetical protein
MTTISLSPKEISRMRLFNQQIAGSRCTTPAEAVSSLGAVQAQDYQGALWAIGLRVPGSTRADIERAIADRTLIRTWAMRGTLHFVAAPDIRWMLTAVASRIIAGNRRRYHELGLDELTLSRSTAMLAEALQGGRMLSRTELRAILERNGISTEGQRIAYLLQRASLDGHICMGAMHRNTPLFLSLDEVLPEGKPVEGSTALAELARRYFSSRGPATLQDFVWWSGLPVGEARAGLEAVTPHLLRTTIDDRTYWLPGSIHATDDGSPLVSLLPGFDEYLLGYRDRSAFIEMPTQKKRVFKNGMLSPTLVIDGRIAGTWKRTFTKDAVIITTNPFTPLTASEKGTVATTAQRYGEFLGMPAVLE